MRGRQSGTGSSAVHGKQLLSERQVFQQEILAGAQQAGQPANKGTKHGDHSENLIAMSDLRLFLQVVHLTKAKGFDDAQAEHQGQS